MAPLLTINQAYDRPVPGPEATDADWIEFTDKAVVIGSELVEERAGLCWKTTFCGPNHHERARLWAQIIQTLALTVEVVKEEVGGYPVQTRSIAT